MRLFKRSSLFLPVAFAFILSACGGVSGPVKVKPDSEKVSGTFSNNLEVAKKEYKIEKAKDGGKLTVELVGKSSSARPPWELEELLEKKIGVEATPLKKDGMPVSGAGTFSMKENKLSELRGIIKNGEGSVFLTLVNPDWKHSKHGNKVKSFKVTSSSEEGDDG